MLKSLGLGGDGDEVDAVEHVEKEFGVSLDTSSASSWLTVGDVYLALQKALPAHMRSDPSTWKRFCVAICHESGADSTLVNEQTRLLAPTAVEQFKSWFKRDSKTSQSGKV